MSRPRDTQRSRVYAFERGVPGLQHGRSTRGTMDLEECAVYAKRVWRAERGRYGLAKRPEPRVEAGRGGGFASGSSLITLGRWARQPMVVLHELAHCLTRGDRHGPRFAGVAIGLYCRHLGMDRDELLAAAYAKGVKVNLTAIGATPEFGWHRRALRALERMGGSAANDIELALEMGVSWRVVAGSLLTLQRQGRVRLRGRRIEVVGAA